MGVAAIALCVLTSCGGVTSSSPVAANDVVVVDASHSASSLVTAGLRNETYAKSTERPSAASRGIIGTEEGKYEDAGNVSTFRFFRANPSKPDSLLVLDYRDQSKVKTEDMARLPVLKDPSGLVRIKFIKYGWWGSSLPVYVTQTQRPILLGDVGDEYSIEIENMIDEPLEIVVSIDGVNTQTRQPASFKGNGYVVKAGEKTVISGWRVDNYGGTRRFKLSSADQSNAAQRNDGKTIPDIGTIGFAIFKSKVQQDAGNRGRAFSDQ